MDSENVGKGEIPERNRTVVHLPFLPLESYFWAFILCESDSRTSEDNCTHFFSHAVQLFTLVERKDVET
jgi:hypothetical protein